MNSIDEAPKLLRDPTALMPGSHVSTGEPPGPKNVNRSKTVICSKTGGDLWSGIFSAKCLM